MATDADKALAALRTASNRLERATKLQVEAMRDRDAALRAARDAGASYIAMQEASGLSAVTVSKALRRQ